MDGHPMYPCAKLKLDQLFLQWLSLPESQTLVSLHCRGCMQLPPGWRPLRSNTRKTARRGLVRQRSEHSVLLTTSGSTLND